MRPEMRNERRMLDEGKSQHYGAIVDYLVHCVTNLDWSKDYRPVLVEIGCGRSSDEIL